MSEKIDTVSLHRPKFENEEADEVSESTLNDLLSVRVSDQGGNTTMIHIDYMRDGLRRSLTISDTCRTSRFRMDVLKELLDR